MSAQIKIGLPSYLFQDWVIFGSPVFIIYVYIFFQEYMYANLHTWTTEYHVVESL